MFKKLISMLFILLPDLILIYRFFENIKKKHVAKIFEK